MFKPLKSSNIRGYDYEGGVLEVTFNNGRSYRYEGVGEDVISGFENAPSHGKYFSQNIARNYKHNELKKD